jgi:hypothetical protein
MRRVQPSGISIDRRPIAGSRRFADAGSGFAVRPRGFRKRHPPTTPRSSSGARSSPRSWRRFELSVFRNSIVANNLATGTPDNCSFNPNTVTSFGYNVTDTDGVECDLTDPTDQTLTDPLLDALANNGGPTETHLLSTASPAIDSGDETHCPLLDQRGFVRPGDGDLNGTLVCDVGAVELPEPSALLGLGSGMMLLWLLERRRR